MAKIIVEKDGVRHRMVKGRKLPKNYCKDCRLICSFGEVCTAKVGSPCMLYRYD